MRIWVCCTHDNVLWSPSNNEYWAAWWGAGPWGGEGVMHSLFCWHLPSVIWDDFEACGTVCTVHSTPTKHLCLCAIRDTHTHDTQRIHTECLLSPAMKKRQWHGISPSLAHLPPSKKTNKERRKSSRCVTSFPFPCCQASLSTAAGPRTPLQWVCHERRLRFKGLDRRSFQHPVFLESVSSGLVQPRCYLSQKTEA